MSTGFSCHCAERAKPIQDRNWVVLDRQANHSAFNGYHWTPSAYSHLLCNTCRASGRTKAAYVAFVPDGRYAK